MKTLACRVHLDSDNGQEGKILILAYPPGNGAINLQNISLTPVTSATAH